MGKQILPLFQGKGFDCFLNLFKIHDIIYYLISTRTSIVSCRSLRVGRGVPDPPLFSLPNQVTLPQ
jgi:hypothetical protein